MYFKRRHADISITLFLGGWFCVGLVWALPNLGGAGLALPQNLLAWSVFALISLYCVIVGQLRHITFPPGSMFILCGTLLWSLPVLWSSQTDWQLNAVPKTLALWGIVAGYFLLLCTTSCRALRENWLLVLVVSALIQAVYAIYQLSNITDLTGGRPYANFQQVNLLASFLATGLACALWLFLRSSHSTLRRIAGSAIFILPLILVVLQSRAAWIGASLSVLTLILVERKHQRSKAAISLLLMAIGVVGGIVLLYSTPGLASLIVDKSGSNFHRLYMIKLTWQLIKLHPIIGNGYGSFEAVYGELAANIPPGIEGATVQYPHNELLYAWMEGGISALLGILLIVAGVLKRLWSRQGAGIAGVALLLPVAVHMNLEYPLYQSITHSIAVVMLVVVCGPGVRKLKAPHPPRKTAQRLLRGSGALLAGSVLVFMVTGLQTQQRLTAVEQNGLQPLVFDETEVMKSLLNPWSQYGRLDFDRHVALLLRFNITHDPALLTQFETWAKEYVQVHNNSDIYASLLTIARARRSQEATNLCLAAKHRWLSDPRFECD
jgi:O-antigen polymerase